jgi:hypothetical protein
MRAMHANHIRGELEALKASWENFPNHLTL